MKSLFTISVLFLASQALSATYCGYLNQVVDTNESFSDQRVVVYNREWSPKFLTVKDQEFVQQVKELVYFTSRDDLSDIYSNDQFEWHYRDSSDLYQVCFGGPEPRAGEGRYRNRRYLDNVYGDIHSLKVNNRTVDIDKTRTQVAFNRTKNQILCLGMLIPQNLLEKRGCFVWQDMCFTGQSSEIADTLNRNLDDGPIWSGDELEIDRARATRNLIKLDVVDIFTMNDAELTREEATSVTKIKRCRPSTVRTVPF